MLLNALNDLDGLADAPRLAETILALMPDSGVMVIDTDRRVVAHAGPGPTSVTATTPPRRSAATSTT